MTLTTAVSQAATRAATRARLFTPGPVEIPVRILRALSQVPPHHRTEVFRATFKRVTESMRELHRTQGELFLIGASGTGAMEAAVVNLLSPSDKALVIVGGKFGERWMNLLKAYGVAFEKIDVEWGHAVDPALVERMLKTNPDISALFSTHSETSTGAIHDIETIAKITRPRGVSLVVDAITSLGIHPLPQDAWGVDVVVCGSQKGLMIPPGLASVSLAPFAMSAIEKDGLPRFYFDLRKARKTAPLGETPWTPPVSLVLALEEALAMISEEGLDNVHLRHRKLALSMRAGAQALGFKLFAANPSHALTALYPPDGVDASAVIKRLRDVHGIVVAGGQDHLKGKIFRIGHMGCYDLGDVFTMMGALEECAGALGRPAKGGTEAAHHAWATA
ncbi:MAG TPA: alanine--glyoxylate aminotransferase family protein [Candidatus Eisenbacteria bacterium]|nr:alanine--glyoxylate aminotransferase family protein [Candidatus Eisenbacteria bacterium]